jgi:hypothetical protein
MGRSGALRLLNLRSIVIKWGSGIKPLRSHNWPVWPAGILAVNLPSCTCMSPRHHLLALQLCCCTRAWPLGSEHACHSVQKTNTHVTVCCCCITHATIKLGSKPNVFQDRC